MSNSREIGISISRYKNVLVEEKAVKEELVNVNHNMADKHITIQSRFLNSAGEFIKEDTTFVSGEEYALLMSDSDIFGVGKLSGVFKDSDLWYMIDKIRGKQTS
ncbi:hypothetical protein [Carnobacterium jeotgali]|uniref:hypothetical protein n=1 Tax=Carnobacterium jeotgali TaxID=545534 RepID=UPI000492F78B|nr:hypothetical protein [Carnobacterium jeotgali]